MAPARPDGVRAASRVVNRIASGYERRNGTMTALTPYVGTFSTKRWGALGLVLWLAVGLTSLAAAKNQEHENAGSHRYDAIGHNDASVDLPAVRPATAPTVLAV